MEENKIQELLEKVVKKTNEIQTELYNFKIENGLDITNIK